jgi:hypothetical protein
MQIRIRKLGIIAFLAIAGCDAQRTSQQVDTTTQVATPEPTPSATPKPEVAAPAIVATPTPAPVTRRLAAEGVYFLLEAISITTSDGIAGLKPGTRVTLVSEAGDTLRLTDGELQFDARRDQLTNDLDVAAQLGRNHSVQQAAVAALNQQQKQTALAMEQKDQQLAAANRQAAEKSNTIRQLQARYDAIVREEISLKTQIEEAYRDDSRQSYGRAIGRVTTRTQLSQQRPAMQARLEAIFLEKTRIQVQLQQLRQ